MQPSNDKEYIIYQYDWFSEGARTVIRQVPKGGNGAIVYVFGDSG